MTYVDIILLVSVLCMSFFTASMIRLKLLGCSIFTSGVGAVLLTVDTVDFALELYIYAYKSVEPQIISPFKRLIFPLFLLVQVAKILPAINDAMSYEIYRMLDSMAKSSKTKEDIQVGMKENFISKLSFA